MNSLKARKMISNYLSSVGYHPTNQPVEPLRGDRNMPKKSEGQEEIQDQTNNQSQDNSEIYNFEDEGTNKEIQETKRHLALIQESSAHPFDKWNPSKNQRILKFEGKEIESLREADQVGRWGIDQEHVTHLAIEIAKDGRQLVPVGVRKGADGQPELVFGRHRRRAILLLNSNMERFNISEPFPLIYVYVNLSEEEAIAACISENTGKPLTVVDQAHIACKLEAKGWDNSRIAEKLSTPWTKVTPVRVSQLKRYMTLPHDTLTKLHQGKLPESAAKALFKVALNREHMIELSDKLEKGEIKAGDLIREANAKSREKGKKVRRGLPDVKEFLEELIMTTHNHEDSSKAEDFLSWIAGEHNDSKRIRSIFIEREKE